MKILRRGGALLLASALFTGCASMSPGGSDSGSAESSTSAEGFDLMLDDGSFDESGYDEASTDSATPDSDPVPAERQIIITGDLYAKSKDPFETAEKVLKLVNDAGGFVEDRTQRGNTDEGNASVYLTVRIPADKTSQAIDDIEEVTEVYEVSTNKQDVTEQVTDVAARISALETSVERLTTLLAEAKTSEALFEAEDALTRRQAELDSLRAVQRSLKDQVSLATLSIYIDSEEIMTTPPEGFMGGLSAGWKALVSTFLSFITALGAIVPWLIVIIPLGIVIFVLLRRARRARAQRRSAWIQAGQSPAPPEQEEPLAKVTEEEGE